MTVPLLELVEYYRIKRGQNLWHPDLLMMDLIYILWESD